MPLEAWGVFAPAPRRQAPRMLAAVGALRHAAAEPLVRGAAAVFERSQARTAAVEAEPEDWVAVGFPLRSRGRLVGAASGAMRGAAAGEGASTAETPVDALARTLASAFEVMGLALDNALRLEEAEALSVTDDLTRLYNSRFLTQALTREVKRARRSGRALALLFLDLDAFKRVNDERGHLAGSRALVEVGQVLRACTRESDILARFGGDEFAVVLPETDEAGALTVAERIRARLAASEVLASPAAPGLRLTVSIGLAALGEPALTSADALLRAADEALYWVKEHGKNAVRIAGGPGPVAARDAGARS